MTSINIVIKAAVPLPSGAPKAAQLAIAAMQAASGAGEALRAALPGAEVSVSALPDDARLTKSNGPRPAIRIAQAAPREKRRGRPRGRAGAKSADDREGHGADDIVVIEFPPVEEPAPVEQQPTAKAEEDLLAVPPFLQR